MKTVLAFLSSEQGLSLSRHFYTAFFPLLDDSRSNLNPDAAQFSHRLADFVHDQKVVSLLTDRSFWALLVHPHTVHHFSSGQYLRLLFQSLSPLSSKTPLPSLSSSAPPSSRTPASTTAKFTQSLKQKLTDWKDKTASTIALAPSISETRSRFRTITSFLWLLNRLADLFSPPSSSSTVVASSTLRSKL
jgi:hypothetical protein